MFERGQVVLVTRDWEDNNTRWVRSYLIKSSVTKNKFK